MTRLSLEYTNFKTIDIKPTWYNINAGTLEANLHIIARFRKTKAYFYPVVGLSYNMFSGYFTGRNDFLGLTERYPTNKVISTNWIGLNVGTGYEYCIKRFSLFLDYKMRVGFSERKNLNIMDVCFTSGLRYTLRVPSVYKIFSGTRSRYVLDTEDPEN
jgi:hypothetical protein